jgi:hypothetical protein
MFAVTLNETSGFSVDIMEWEKFRDGLKEGAEDLKERMGLYDCVIGLNELQCDMRCAVLQSLLSSLTTAE